MKRTNKKRQDEVYRFDPHVIPESFLRSELARSANAMAVADCVFDIEKAFRNGGKIREVKLGLYDTRVLGYDIEALQKLLHDLIVFVSQAEDIGNASIGRTRFEPETRKRTLLSDRAGTVCLFSGGVDSYVGILLAQKKFGDVVGVFAAHSDQARMIHIVRSIEQRVLTKLRIELHELRVPSVGLLGYAQLRGFLYVVGAAAWVNVLHADRILVTECGPTMYQPRFSPFDSITMTTHPVVMRFASGVIEAVLKRKVDIVTPFEDLTKAEVLAISPRKAGLRLTHSCISQRFGRHDGTCYGCVIRRLAAIAAGVDDVQYEKNPILDGNARAGNLMTLLAYSRDLLVDYPRMDAFEIETIEEYSKQNLFKRFALDNFAAIHRLVQGKHRVRPAIRQMYNSLVERIGISPLTARLRELREGDFTPAL